jgi:hypothetical protein
MHRTAKDKTRGLPGPPGATQIELSDLRKRNSEIISDFSSLSTRAGVQARHPLGYPLLWPGLMFSSIQAMNTAELCHSGQTVMPRRP